MLSANKKKKIDGHDSRTTLFNNALRGKCPPSVLKSVCQTKDCGQPAVVTCYTCCFPSRVFFCANCDARKHGGAQEQQEHGAADNGMHCLMHDREMEDNTSGQKPSMTKLIPTHFVHVEDGVNKTYVQQLCLQPNLDAVCCPDCPAGGELASKPLPSTGTRCIVIVVTMKGRYEFTKGEIICSLCTWRRPHDVDDDYGDLFPGTCNSAANPFLVAADALSWYASL